MIKQRIKTRVITIKTLTIMSTIITAATIMALYLNTTGDANSKYYYNADIENGTVKTMQVLANGGDCLEGKVEYRFTYDASGKLATKEVCRYNMLTGKYEPKQRYDYQYTSDGFNVERHLWNADRACFDRADSRTEYRRESRGTVSVTNYEARNFNGDMTKVNNVLLMQPMEQVVMSASL
ncbi:MAG: DUF3836 domain-containing protein [Prevotella sp.]|nr:DUF3836 domain-containing protein [Prevotella sp.]MDY6027912.1 DUF3836 domain-containing protein [Prevotella sp.]